VTLVDVSEETGHDGVWLRMVKCPLCGAEHGTDYTYYSWHVLAEHSPADVGLEEWST